MWTAKIQLDSQDTLIGSKVARHKVTATGQVLSSWPQEDSVFSAVAGFVHGDATARRAFLDDMRTDPRVLRLETDGNFLLALLKDHKYTSSVFYNPLVMLVRPLHIAPDGTGTYEFGSWDRQELEKLVDVLKKHRNAKLVRFTEEKLTNVTFLGILPEITDKQKTALRLAIHHGYYDYPRKTELRDLAKLMHASLSTYREHLRVAERKVMPKLL